jgi:hypothetical protein
LWGNHKFLPVITARRNLLLFIAGILKVPSDHYGAAKNTYWPPSGRQKLMLANAGPPEVSGDSRRLPKVPTNYLEAVERS